MNHSDTVTGDEETVEVEQVSEADAVDSMHDAAGFDSAAESFLELEADLDRTLDGDETTAPGQFRGLVVDAERVDATVVPDEYPVVIDTDQAIAFRVDRGGSETTVYLEWPGESGEDAPLPWLLTAIDVELSDLYGRELLLERVDGHDVVVVPSEHPRESDAWGPCLAVTHVLNAGLVGLLFAAGGLPSLLYVVWFFLTLVALPYATYRDAWYVRTHSDWGHGPLFWAALSMLPLFNVFVGAMYFWTRSRARFFGTERSLLTRAGRMVRSWL